MSFTILSDVSKQYLQEEDAVKGFRVAVENGQARLALQILTDIIDAFNEVFVEAFEADEVVASTEEVPAIEPTAPVATEATSAELDAPAAEEQKPKAKAAPKKDTEVTE